MCLALSFLLILYPSLTLCHLQSDPAPIPVYGTDSLFLGMSSFRNTNQMSSRSWAILTFDYHFLKLLSDLNQVTFCFYLLILFVIPQVCYLNCAWGNQNNLFTISLIKSTLVDYWSDIKALHQTHRFYCKSFCLIIVCWAAMSYRLLG